MQKRRRIVRVLLFPVSAFIFVLDWLDWSVSLIGESRTDAVMLQRKEVIPKKHNALNKEDSIEMGLMEQLAEEQITAE